MARRVPARETGSAPSGIRCAVYTRKSTEEGLEQAFNSLDAQFEACAAYILSQRHEGWTQVKERYDDGGFSGGNMERPGLKRLLADVEAGKVNVIVVYKVDRLTRALSDFAKIVEVLDARGASFVSVTQAFNTTTSMGRLTLNVLLSFAQFEREVTGERIRDKIAASKAKGMWMGGNPPLGYDVHERKLVVNEPEAAAVRHIMQRYVALGTGRALIEELRTTGYRTKQSRTRGGILFERGSLFHLLSNRIYLGEVVHKGTSYPGEHDAIVPIELWDAVQQRLCENRVERREGSNVRDPSLLAGLLTDGLGRRMSPSHAVKAGKRYRYYATPASELTDAAVPAWRVPAHDLETAVISRLLEMLNDRSFILTIARESSHDADASAMALALAQEAATRIHQYRHKKPMICALVRAVRLADDHVAIDVDRGELSKAIGITSHSEDAHPDIVTLITRATRIRRGKDVRLVIADNDGRAKSIRDDTLVALLAEARTTFDEMLAVPDRSIKQLARDTHRCRTRVANLLKLAQLAPDIVESCLEGTHPATLTAKMLMQAKLPLAWTDQRTLLGFA